MSDAPDLGGGVAHGHPKSCVEYHLDIIPRVPEGDRFRPGDSVKIGDESHSEGLVYAVGEDVHHVLAVLHCSIVHSRKRLRHLARPPPNQAGDNICVRRDAQLYRISAAHPFEVLRQLVVG